MHSQCRKWLKLYDHYETCHFCEFFSSLAHTSRRIANNRTCEKCEQFKGEWKLTQKLVTSYDILLFFFIF
jgi:hypothetical protein